MNFCGGVAGGGADVTGVTGTGGVRWENLPSAVLLLGSVIGAQENQSAGFRGREREKFCSCNVIYNSCKIIYIFSGIDRRK